MRVERDSECVLTSDKRHVWTDIGVEQMWCMACGNWMHVDKPVDRAQTLTARIQVLINDLKTPSIPGITAPKQVNATWVAEQLQSIIDEINE